MGCSPSSDVSEDEEYVVPWNEQWRHAKCTVRAPHQLIILDKPGYCDFCQIVKYCPPLLGKPCVVSLNTGKLSDRKRPLHTHIVTILVSA